MDRTCMVFSCRSICMMAKSILRKIFLMKSAPCIWFCSPFSNLWYGNVMGMTNPFSDQDFQPSGSGGLGEEPYIL